MKRAEVLANIVWMTLGCGLCLGSLKLGLGTPGDPQSGFLPFGTGILLIILGCIQCVRYYAEGGTVHSRMAIWTGATWRRPAIVVAVLALYALFLPHLGYLITTAVVMLSLFTLYGRRHLVLAFGGSLLISFLTYFVFHELLRVQLPSGLIGFGG